MGASTMQPGKLHLLNVKRTKSKVTVLLDGESTGLHDLTLDGPVKAIGWRPWRNTMKIRSLFYALQAGEDVVAQEALKEKMQPAVSVQEALKEEMPPADSE